jgi:hypothetical protein
VFVGFVVLSVALLVRLDPVILFAGDRYRFKAGQPATGTAF